MQAQIDRTYLTFGLIALTERRFEATIECLDALRFTDPDLEAERLIAWAAAHNALERAVTITPDLSLARSVQGLRWRLEAGPLSGAELEEGAAQLASTGTALFETLQARRAWLRQYPNEALRALHERELERLSANLPIHLRESFKMIHR